MGIVVTFPSTTVGIPTINALHLIQQMERLGVKQSKDLLLIVILDVQAQELEMLDQQDLIQNVVLADPQILQTKVHGVNRPDVK